MKSLVLAKKTHGQWTMVFFLCFLLRPQGHDGGGQQPMPPAGTLPHLVPGHRAPAVGAERVAGYLVGQQKLGTMNMI